MKVKNSVLKNPKGKIGIVYEVYQLGNDHQGVSVIFSNGAYDGFNTKEIKWFLEYHDQLPDFTYEFTNVMKLARDFNLGLFPFDKIQ